MKKVLKRSMSFVLAFAIVLTSMLAVPTEGNEVKAASSYSFDEDSTNTTVYYFKNSESAHYVNLYIENYPNASSVKSLKSSNTSIARAYATGYCIRVYYRKAGTVTISCKIGNQTIKTKLYVKSCKNVFKSFKIGNTNFTSKFNYNDSYEYYHTKAIKSSTLAITAASGWKVYSVSAYTSGSSKSESDINKSSYSLKKVSLNTSYDSITVRMINTKTNRTYVFDLDACLED